MCPYTLSIYVRKKAMIEVTEKTIDIDRLLRSKLGDKARYVPRFLVNWLKKLIWEDRINEFLWESRDEVGVPWLKHGLRYLGNEIVVDGWENLPDATDGMRFTFVSNHPLGGIDGIAIGTVLGDKYGENFKYLVNDLLMNLPGLAPLCIPNSERFYRIANICKMLHLKVNIAMLYLADEMFRNEGKTFKIKIGKPIAWQTFDRSKSPQEWAKYVEDLVYKL